MINAFQGVRVNVVEAGTVVGQNKDGADMIVTDTSAVFNGGNAWVTQKIYDALKQKGGA